MTAESAREKIRALLEKRGNFTEQGMKKDLFIADTGANKVGVDIFGEKPIVGVFLNGVLEEEGHGVEAVYSLRNQILAIWVKEVEHPAPKPPLEKKIKLHQMLEGTSVCVHCGKPSSEWKPMEVCQPKAEVNHEKKHPEKKEGEDTKVEERKANAPEIVIPGKDGAKPLEPKSHVMPAEVVAPEKAGHKPEVRIPVRTTSPQGNYIKGLVPMMKEIGKIKIGTKGEVKTSGKGTQYRPPVKFDHFEIVSVLRDEKGNLIPDPVMKEFGENPKELDIFLLYNDETLNFTTRYNEYKGGKCQCSGDGVKARTLDGSEIECNPDTCPTFKEKRCKPNGILSVILTKSPRLGGVYKFRTTSYNSIRSILSSLFFIKSLTGGVLAMIPLKLTVSPMTVQPKDSATAQTIYVVNVEFRGTIEQLLEKTVEVSKYQSLMRGQIQELEATARAALCLPESEEEIKEIVAEFYPKTQEEAKA